MSPTPRRTRAAERRRAGPSSLCVIQVLVFFLLASVLATEDSGSSSSTASSCCAEPYSLVDCNSGDISLFEDTYTCKHVGQDWGCWTCLSNATAITDAGIVCSYCCATDSACSYGYAANRTVTWAAYTATVLFLSVCVCCSVLCAFTEKRRRRKGISFAQAYSLPQGMPMVQATVRSMRTRRRGGHGAVVGADGADGGFDLDAAGDDD
ncbi:unnamed protein product, partial [Phaeothamnion confervicola]